MPFQSEKQRRYLWANEPEIARDWTDTYGSRVRKANGGIMEGLLMKLAQTYGVNKAMEMLGMQSDSDQDENFPGDVRGYMRNYISNFSPTKTLTRFGLNQAFKGLTGQGSGMMAAVGPIAGIAGLGYMLNKNRLGLTGHLTQRDFDANRARSRAKTSQSNIIDTLLSGKYVPGWEKSAFERVQKLGEEAGLVDADDMSLTTTKHTPYVNPNPEGPHGNGHQGGNGAQGTPSSEPGGHVGGQGGKGPARWAEGGLISLWPR